MKRLVIPIVAVIGFVFLPLANPGGGPLGRISVAHAGGVPTLANEVFQLSTFTVTSGSCQPPDVGNSVIGFTATGTAKGPVSGTYTQSGTITTGNNMLGGPVNTLSVSGTFTITDNKGSTEATGSVVTTTSPGAPGPGIDPNVPTGSSPFGYCSFPQLNVDAFVDYTATVGNTTLSAEAELTVGPANGSPTQSTFQQTVLTSTTISCLTSIDMPFGGTAIPAGDTIWMPAVIQIPGKGSSSGATFNFTGQTITYTANGTPYSYNVPDSSVTFSPTATTATTSYSPVTSSWSTTVPLGGGGKTFLAGVQIPVPAGGLPGGIKPVTWSGQISSATHGVDVHWQWGASVYTTFSSDYTTLGVETVNDPGTPLNFQQYMTGGARNNGWSATGKCTT